MPPAPTPSRRRPTTLARRIADAFIDPFAGILAALALVSLYIDVLAVPEPQRDPSTVIVIGIMLLVSGGMKFIQEARSGNAAEALKDLVSNTCTVLRDGERVEILFDELVPGDVIRLSAGDMVPADARVITARDLFVIESALTGESEAVEKTAAVTVVDGADGSALPLSACKNIVFTGTSVQNGTAMALVVATGSDTYLAASPRCSTGAARRARLTTRLERLHAARTPHARYGAGRLCHQRRHQGNVIDALLFATSVAVGITPQMLPVIVTTSLSQAPRTSPVARLSSRSCRRFKTSARWTSCAATRPAPSPKTASCSSATSTPMATRTRACCAMRF